MDANDMYQSKWLSAEDLKEDVKVTVTNVIKEEFKEGSETKLVLEFDEIDKGLPLNKTNGKKMIKLFGSETDKWVGQVIELYKVLMTYKGEEVGSIRIKTPSPSGGQKDVEAFM